jgi:hypothetical protein
MALAVLAAVAGLLIPAGVASAATAAPAHPATAQSPATGTPRHAAGAGSAGAARASVRCNWSEGFSLTPFYVNGVLDSVSGSFQGAMTCNKDMDLLRINVDLTRNGVTVGTGRDKCTRPFCRSVGVSESYSCTAGVACAGTYQADLDIRAILNSGSWRPARGCVAHGRELICHEKSGTAVIPPTD